MSFYPPIPQSKHHAASPDAAGAPYGRQCLQNGLRHVPGLSPFTHTPALWGSTSAPAASSKANQTGNRSGSFVSSPGPSMVTESILTASSTWQGPPPPPCAWRAAPEPTPARQVHACMVQLVCTVVPQPCGCTGLYEQMIFFRSNLRTMHSAKPCLRCCV